MWNRRFSYYFIGGGIVLLSALYWGYKAYQSHVGFEAFISGFETFQQSIDKDNLPNRDVPSATESPVPNEKEFEGYQSRVDSSTIPVKVKLQDGDPIGMVVETEWIVPSDIPSEDIEPEEEEGITTWTADEMVPQLIELPNGHIIEILSVPGEEIQEGEAVSLEELGSMMAHRVTHIEQGGISYEVPIDIDPEAFDKKASWAYELQESVEEIDRMLANRELIIKFDGSPLTPEEREINFTAVKKRPEVYARWLAENRFGNYQPPPSDEKNTVSKDSGISEEASVHKDRSDALLSSSDLSDRVDATPSPPSVADLEKQLTPEGIEGELSGGLSPDSFDKAQQLIDQYGTEEGLRRLRKMDPDAARRFERERSGAPSRDVPKGHTHPDGQSRDDSP